jgi:hypothetical protein
VALTALPEHSVLYRVIFLRTHIANLAGLLRSALFGDITQRRAAKDYHTMLRNDPEECRSRQHHGRSLISWLAGLLLETVACPQLAALEFEAVSCEAVEMCAVEPC